VRAPCLRRYRDRDIREKETGETGALLRSQNGVYAQMNRSKIRA